MFYNSSRVKPDNEARASLIVSWSDCSGGQEEKDEQREELDAENATFSPSPRAVIFVSPQESIEKIKKNARVGLMDDDKRTTGVKRQMLELSLQHQTLMDRLLALGSSK